MRVTCPLAAKASLISPLLYTMPSIIKFLPEEKFSSPALSSENFITLTLLYWLHRGYGDLYRIGKKIFIKCTKVAGLGENFIQRKFLYAILCNNSVCKH
jgi:hypothetical protein